LRKEDGGCDDRQGVKTKQPKETSWKRRKENTTNLVARVFGDVHRLNNVFLESREQSLDTHISLSSPTKP
jgi:hypothetical protein